MDVRLLVLVLVVGACVAAFTHWRKAQRRREVRAVATRMGLAPSVTDPLAAFPFNFFWKGDGRGTENVFEGETGGLPVVMFDYWYYEESTDSDGHRQRRYRRFTCGVSRVDAACPPLTIAEENLLTRAANSMGFRDVEVESDAFNRRFRLTCNDERFAFAFCAPAMIDHLLGLPKGFEIEMLGPWLLVRSKPLAAADWWTSLRVLRDTASEIPSTVRRLYPLGEGAA